MKLFKKDKCIKKRSQSSSFKKYFGLTIGFWDIYSKMDTESGVNISQEIIYKIYERVTFLEKKNIIFNASKEDYDTTLNIYMKEGVLVIYGFWNMNEEETIDEIIGARFVHSI